MNIISVEHLPSLAVCTKGTLRGASQNLKQGRCVPPLTIVSKGKAVTSNNVMVKGRTPTLTMVSKGNVVTCNAAIKDHLPPLTVVSKGRAVNNDAVVKDQLREAGLPPQLAVIQKTPSINMNSGKMSMVSDKFSKITGSSKKPLIVKTYKSISAPAPLFGPFKSRIPLASKTPSMLIDSGTNKVNDNSIGASNIDDPSVIIMDSSIGASNLDDPSVIIVESTDKAVQTECFCQCYRTSDSGTHLLLDEIKKISTEIKDLKLNITGKTATKMMDGIFPIKSEADLIKIQHNMENTDNFELRLKLYLKYLKPKSSTSITTAIFQQLISDEFLKGKNWDGGNNFEPINKYTFFKTTLFDAWKNSAFTNDRYIAAMRHEIGKSHDRERKRINKNKLH